MQQDNNIVIRRSKSGSSKSNSNGSAKSGSGKAETGKSNFYRHRSRQMMIFSVLLFFFSIFLFLALISFTAEDRAKTDIAFFDLFGLVTGDELIQAKAETTQNWLGIVGAFIAEFSFGSAFGYVMIFLPLFLVFWAKNLFSHGKVTDYLIRRSTFYLLLGILLSGFMGVLRNTGWFSDMSLYWSGAAGSWLADLTGSFAGVAGAFIIFVAAIAVSVIIGFEINLVKASESLKGLYLRFLPSLDKIIEKITRKNNEPEQKHDSGEASEKVDVPENEQQEPLDESLPEKQEDTPEPARIIQKNFEYEETKADSDEHEPEEEEKKSVFDEFKSRFNRIVEPPGPKQQESIKEEPPEHEQEEKPKPKPVIKQVDRRIREDIRNSEKFKQTVRIKPEQPKPDGRDFRTRKPLNNNENLQNPEFEHSDEEIEDFIENNEEQVKAQDDSPKLDIDFEKINLAVSEYEKRMQSGESESEDSENTAEPDESFEIIDEDEEIEKPDSKKPKLVVTVTEQEEVEETDSDLSCPLGTMIHDEEINYKYPTKDLLIPQTEKAEVNDDELKMNAKLLQEKLETFKINIENLQVTPGPVVTQYEFVPAAGIKVSKIENLADDLAMALKAKGIRIIAPIPGKGTVGIEIPNNNPSIVRFSSVLNSKEFHETNYRLPLALGKTISGEVFITDLSKMPHLLIAGATGAGKSVGINTIIASLIYKMHPSRLKFVIIDPKKVELQQYARLGNHFLAISPDVDDRIVTNPKDAVTTLKAVVAEMELRYDILSAVGQRNIKEYNKKVRDGKLKTQKDMIHRPMPYIVVIIDELADLMLTASKEVEEPITRLAQMARAVGIHLVLATQRPSVDVITGIIKANFPARVAYQVAQKVDSRTILDMMGAEQLLGNGDMLIVPNGSPKPIRLQNSFISTDEVDALCDFIGKQRGYSEPYYLPDLNDKKSGNIDLEDRDELFEDAARLVIRSQQGSVSMLQRRLKIGYARAGRIIDELEMAGVVGSHDGSKAREVLLESESDLEAVL